MTRRRGIGRLGLAAAALLGLAASAAADRIDAGAGRLPARERARPPSAAAATPAAGLAGARLYDNTGNPANTYYSAQGGAEAIDDLHIGAPATLDSLVFEYYDPAPGGTFSATATLYANPGGQDLGTRPLAGPFTVSGLPRGRRAVAIALPQLAVDGDLWVGVQFTSPSAGLIVHSVPSVGASHDYYLENGHFYWFGGDPQANFGLRLIGSSERAGVGVRSFPDRVALAAPRPNPFRAGAALDFALPRRGRVRLEILDTAGRRVRSLVDGLREAGRHSEPWSGRDDAGRIVPPGLYLARLVAADGAATRKLVLAP